jgi:UDP-glucose 4-epimerase
MLLARGDVVVAVARTRARDVQALQADLRDAGAVSSLAEGTDCVVHLAALLPAPGQTVRPQEWFEHNALATLNLLESCARHGVRSFVYGSTWSVYGDPSRQGRVGEEQAPAPDDLYSASKLAGELYCKPFEFAHGVVSSVLRFSYLYGAGMRADTVVMRFLDAAAKGETLTVLDGGRDATDLVHVSDAARAVVAACDRACGTCNIGAGRPTTVRELAEAAIAATRFRTGLADKPSGNAPRRMYLSTQRAKDRLAWGPQVDLVTGLRDLRQVVP